MAENGVDRAADDAIELEVMRKDDFSWHPCQVTLRSYGHGLVIEYGDDCMKESIVDKEVALTRLRIRSTPLQGTDCSLVKEGDHVLAAKKSQSKSLFFDAKVEKFHDGQVQRVRHSARTLCRCSFTVKWLHKDLGDEALVLPSCAVMKLNTESVNAHPIVVAAFNSFNSSTINGSRMERGDTPEPPIENRSTDIFEDKFSDDILLGGIVQTWCSEFTTQSANITYVQVPPVTENGNKLYKDKEAEDSPGVFMLIKDDESVEKRSRLTPLAARAALASLVSNFSRGSELLVHKEREEFGRSMKRTKNPPQKVKNVKNQNRSSTRRPPRSAARKDSKNSDLDSSLSWEQSKLSHSSQSDTYEGESNMTDGQNSNFDSVVSEAHSPPARKKNKINRTHATTKKTGANEGNSIQHKSIKRKLVGSTTHQLRSSPRLNSLPRN